MTDSTTIPVCVRAMRPDEARRFLEIHHESVRGLAAVDYSPAVIEAWAAPIASERLHAFLRNRTRKSG